MDHAGEELERSAELLHHPVARAHDQSREIGIMQSLPGYAREGEKLECTLGLRHEVKGVVAVR
jgi:hypothetical protein